MEISKVSGFCVIEVNEAKTNPAWSSPFVLVPISFFKPDAVGNPIVYYPSPPYQYDLTVELDNAVRQQASPDISWGEKTCKMINLAATYDIGVQILKSTKDARKPRRRKANNVPKKLEPMEKLVKKMNKNTRVSTTVHEAPRSTPPNIVPQNGIQMPLCDISNMEVSISSVPVDSNTGMMEVRGSGENVVQECLTPPMDQVQFPESLLIRNNLTANPVLPDNEITTNSNSETALSNSAMKLNLFSTVPGLPENFDSLIPQPNPSLDPTSDLTMASFESSSSTAFDASSANDNSSFDLNQFLVLNNTNSQLNTMSPSPAITAAPQSEEYVLVNKTQLFDLGNFIATRVQKSVEAIIGKIVEKKTKTTFDNLDQSVQEMYNTLIGQRGDRNNILTYDQFKTTHNLNLPAHTYELFLEKFITSTISRDTDAQDNLRGVLKRFMDNEVLVLFTASRSNRSKSKYQKPIFKTTTFGSCLLESFLIVYKIGKDQKLSENAFFRAFGNVINNARTILGPEVVAKLESVLPLMSLDASLDANNDLEDGDEDI
ncbi:hypothetical protein QAD02_007071 [Eretmocerus hayati]|uniref:Uncharacterized protein n=1 Tax=Eretmocerus hayati TaxID=131215 RepID=A0ACC2N2L3_9HYME|nr:hypothetical protein QAD02_007071 [Eretmocerus hayati]